MKNVNDDITTDGWLALCIAILCGVPQQEAFRRLDNPFGKRHWTEEDYAEIEHFLKQGASWSYIADMLKAEKTTVFRQYHRWKAKKKKCV